MSQKMKNPLLSSKSLLKNCTSGVGFPRGLCCWGREPRRCRHWNRGAYKPIASHNEIMCVKHNPLTICDASNWGSYTYCKQNVMRGLSSSYINLSHYFLSPWKDVIFSINMSHYFLSSWKDVMLSINMSHYFLSPWKDVIFSIRSSTFSHYFVMLSINLLMEVMKKLMVKKIAL